MYLPTYVSITYLSSVYLCNDFLFFSTDFLVIMTSFIQGRCHYFAYCSAKIFLQYAKLHIYHIFPTFPPSRKENTEINFNVIKENISVKLFHYEVIIFKDSI
jgi:hypothetical protein